MNDNSYSYRSVDEVNASPKAFKLSADKLLDFTKIRVMLHRTDNKGKRIPFRIRFVTKKGELCDWSNCVTTSVNIPNGTHNIISLDSNQSRTIKDILILMIDDVKITLN